MRLLLGILTGVIILSIFPNDSICDDILERFVKDSLPSSYELLDMRCYAHPVGLGDSLLVAVAVNRPESLAIFIICSENKGFCITQGVRSTCSPLIIPVFLDTNFMRIEAKKLVRDKDSLSHHIKNLQLMYCGRYADIDCLDLPPLFWSVCFDSGYEYYLFAGGNCDLMLLSAQRLRQKFKDFIKNSVRLNLKHGGG